jgi:carbonic anhydrase/acetyltransferase-like protein (isoleucine patch superfamily)
MTGTILPFDGITPTVAADAFVAETATLIGNDVTIGHLALIHACILEDESFVGMRAVVMNLAVEQQPLFS